MEILYLLIPMSLVLVFVIAAIFWWCLRSGQFDDLEGPGYRILMDDDSTDKIENPGNSSARLAPPSPREKGLSSEIDPT
ncbi:MAG: cbb3-type cytochrome oxidase assembly protein CcoS [Rhodocyclaceae bacterium]|nr:MAG: cbb3-type cytochrome oxidase assembly protein CcoS [Rhodocyclaceae bacterium]